jgi:hypothetical protein
VSGSFSGPLREALPKITVDLGSSADDSWLTRVEGFLGDRLTSEAVGPCAESAVLMLGGPLEGIVRPLLSGGNPVWDSPDGGRLMRVAVIAEAQFAVVLRSDGVVGASWAGEFNPLYGSWASMLEDAAVWWGLRGAHYVTRTAVGHGDVIRDVTRDASPTIEDPWVRWWLADDWAVGWHRSPNAPSQPDGVVSVVAADRAAAHRLRESLSWLSGVDVTARAGERVGLGGGSE